MADNVVTNRFVGDSSSAVRAIALIEKEVADLSKAYKTNVTAAKQAAMDKKAAAKEEAQGVAADAKQSRRVFRAAVAEQKQIEKDAAAEKKRIAHDEANESRRVFRATSRALIREERERTRAKKDEARERKRIERDESRSQQQLMAWATGIGGIAAGYVGVSAVLDTIIQQHDEFIRKSEEHGLSLDKMTRRLRTQLSLNGEEGKAAVDKLTEIAIDAAVEPQVAVNAAIELGGQGFSDHEATGAAARTILELQSAGNTSGEDPGPLVEAAAQIMRNRGLEMTDKNLRETMIPLQRISKPLNLKLSDSPQWAGKSSQISAALNDPLMEDALQGQMRSYTDPSVAGSASKATVQRLQTMRNDKQAMKWLTAAKVSPDKMDLIGGENLIQALDAVDEVFKKTKPTDVPSAAEDMFGKEYGPLIQQLVKDRNKLQGLREVAADTKGFDKDVEVSRSGKTAFKNRNEALGNKQFADRETDVPAILDVADQYARDRGDWEATIWTNRFMANRMSNFSGVEQSASYIVPESNDLAAVLIEAQKRKGVEPLKGLTPEWQEVLRKAMESNTKAVEKNNDLMAAQNAGNKPPAPAAPKKPVPVNAGE